MKTVNLSTFNGFKVEVVEEGAKVRDLGGKKPEIAIDDRTIGIAGNRLYVTETTWARLQAGTEDDVEQVKATDSTVDRDTKESGQADGGKRKTRKLPSKVSSS